MIGKMKILVGLSWGVDSAVAAYLLKEQGHEVVAGFMKNYVSEEWNCTTYQDSIDAIKVAEYLWIEIRAYDLQKEYQEKIIDYIFEGYQRGITPNPDVLCNSLIKFDVFLQKALAEGFDKIATGHYAQILPSLFSHYEQWRSLRLGTWLSVLAYQMRSAVILRDFALFEIFQLENFWWKSFLRNLER